MASRTRRLGYALVGFVAGDAALLLYMLLNAFWVRSELLAVHMGEPYAQIPAAIQLFTLYAPFSFAGFLFVGVPVVLLFPVRPMIRWPWFLVVTVGALLGPLALVIILLLLRARFEAWLIFLSIVASTVAFMVYVALLRRHVGRDNPQEAN